MSTEELAPQFVQVRVRIAENLDSVLGMRVKGGVVLWLGPSVFLPHHVIVRDESVIEGTKWVLKGSENVQEEASNPAKRVHNRSDKSKRSSS